MGDATRRLFFALWPDRTVRTQCDWYASALLGKRVRRVSAANLHLTLGFAGSVDRDTGHCLEARADELQLPPFSLTIDHLGYWPKPRILWIGPRNTPAELWQLAGAIRDLFSACGVQQDKRAFRAHMTLARKFSGALPAGDAPAIGWPVSEFCLLQSVSTDHGVSYRVLRSWALEGD